MTVGERIKSSRIAKGATQEELAKVQIGRASCRERVWSRV